MLCPNIKWAFLSFVYLLYIKGLVHLCFEAIFLKYIWKGPLFHDLTWATFSHDIGKMSIFPSVNYRACVIATKTPPCCFVHLNKLIPQFIQIHRWLRIPTWLWRRTKLEDWHSLAYYKLTVFKTVLFWGKTGNIGSGGQNRELRERTVQI